MATRNRVLIPAHPDDLYCVTCPERFPFQGSLSQTMDLARGKGWAVWLVGAVGKQAICPDCKGTPRSREKPPLVLEGQSDLLAELGVTITAWDKESRKKRKDPS